MWDFSHDCGMVDTVYGFVFQLKVYSDQTQIAVTYVDEDDESVIVSCQEDICEAFKVRNKYFLPLFPLFPLFIRYDISPS